MFGSTELIIIVLIIFILFGAKSIPKFAKSLGEARKEFQKTVNDNQSDDEKKTDKPSDSISNIFSLGDSEEYGS